MKRIAKLLAITWLLFCSTAYGQTTGVDTGIKALLSSGGSESATQAPQADLFSGAGTYSLVLPVPPGAGGLKPNLVLNYNSQRKNANSWVGYGWELDMGYIERAPETNGRIDYESGTHYLVRYNGQTQDLAMIEQQVDPTYYGLSPSSCDWVDAYQASVESTFVKYFHSYTYAMEGTMIDCGWLAIDKSGSTYHFGTDQEYHSTIYSLFTNSDGVEITRTSRWNLDLITDSNTNILEVTYGTNYLPEVISYGDIAITFDTNTVNYFPIFKQYGQDTSTVSTLLESVTVSHNGSRLQKYTLNYTNSEIATHHLLASITQSGGSDSEELPPTTFDYYDLDTASFKWSSTSTDFDLSGLKDDCLGSITGTWGSYDQLIDMNGDGLPDLVASCYGSDVIKVYFNNGNEFEDRGAASNWTDPIHDATCNMSGNHSDWCGNLSTPGPDFVSTSENNMSSDDEIYLMDINGDTLPDRIYTTDSSSGSYQKDFMIALNTGTGWDATLLTWRDPFLGNNGDRKKTYASFFDMNGDGLTDRVVGMNSISGFNVYFNNGAGFEETEDYWLDPVSYFGDTTGTADIYSPWDEDYIQVFIRDFNGDGYADRFRQGNCYSGGTMIGVCEVIDLNREGHEWAFPAPLASDPTLAAIDGIDNLAIIDPISDTNYQGKISAKYDWIDMNGDGLLDRIEGNPTTGTFNIYFYTGTNPGDEYGEISAAITLTDPISDAVTTYESQGYISNLNKVVTIDMNADGYPDRVYSDGTALHAFALQVNPLQFSDATTTADDPNINQPPLALKSVDDGKGRRMVMEYLPSTIKRRSSDHRFLPFNVYTVHKIYFEDPTVIVGDGTIESIRNPGMRYSTYNYYGGNFYIRYAQSIDPTNPDEHNLSTTQYATFNGFQDIEVTSSPSSGETWPAYTEAYTFIQALGDIHTVDAADETFYDAAAYLDLPRSGTFYKKTKTSGTTTLSSLQFDWQTTNLLSDPDINFVWLQSKTETLTEPGESTSRRYRTDYTYDTATGNLLTETLYDKNDAVLLQSTSTYFDESSFAADLMIRNRLESQTTTDGATTFSQAAYVYDTLGNLTDETHYADATTTYTMRKTHDSFGNVETVTGYDGVTHTFTYDSDGVFITSDSAPVASAGTYTKTFEHDRFSGSITNATDNSGVQTQSTYDDFGRPLTTSIVSISGTSNIISAFDYDYDTYSVDGVDATLLKTSVWQPQSGYADTDITGSAAQISYANAFGHVLQKCDKTERGNYRLVQYRTFNGQRGIEQTAPTFASTCDFVATFNSSAGVIASDLDEFNRVTNIDFPDGDSGSPVADISIDYTTNSDGYLVKTVTDTSGKTVSETYDDFNRLISKTDPNSSTLTYDYDAIGNPLVVYGNGTALLTTTYDWLGRKKTSTDNNMGTWSYAYNSSAQLERQTDNKGQYTQLTYDTAGRLSQKSVYNSGSSLEHSEVFTYDSGDADHNVALGELFSISEYDSSSTLQRTSRHGYDSSYRYVSKLTRSLDEGDFTQTIVKDFRGLDQSITYPGGTSLYYSYDRIGRLATVCSVSGCSSGDTYYSTDAATGYDEYGRLLQESFGNGVSSTFTYFANSHRLQSSVIGTATLPPYSSRSFSYDYAANITAIADAISSPGAASFSNATYDNLDRLTSYTPTSSAAISFSYDASGNMQTNGVGYAGKTYTYGSSKPHAVTQIDTETFAYDNNGNMTSDASRTMTYDSQNHLTNVAMTNGSSVAYNYDFSGARAEKTSTRTNPDLTVTTSTTRYLGDAIEIRDNTVVLNIFAGSQKIATRTLGTITDILGAGSSLRITYIDPSNRFVRFFPWLCLLLTLLMLASFRPLAPPTPVWGVGFRLALEGRDRSLRSKGRERVILPLLTLWHHYTHAMSEALQSFPHNAWQKSLSLSLIAALFFTSIPMPTFAAAAETDFFYYHHGDHLGSTNVITEGNTSAIHSGITYAKGDIVQRFEYSPYGQESYVLNPGLDLEVSYTGQDYDVESGLYYYNSRYYNPQLGRFIQPDTMIPDPTNLQAYNRYSYVHNNPLNYTDPSGHNEYGGESPSVPTNGYNPNPSGGGQSASGVGGVLSFILNTAIASMAIQSMVGSITTCDNETGTKCSTDASMEVISYMADTTPAPLPVAADGMPDQGFGEIFGVVEYSLDVADAIPVAGEVAEGNLSTLYVPEGVDASDYGILVSMYTHFQNGNKTDLNINASTLDFSGTTQGQLGLENMIIGRSKSVNLFQSGINQNSLAFGNVKMTYQGNDQFEILRDTFNFDIKWLPGFKARNFGTVLGAVASYGYSPFVPLLFGGPYNVIFHSTATIPK